MVRNNRYSVPARLIGRRVRVLLHASDLVIYDRRTEIARYERLPGRTGARLDLDHYLEALVRKPGALPGATALEQARAAGKFTPVHDAWWAAARKAHGHAAGTRALVQVLLLHRHMDGEHVVAGLAGALRAGAAHRRRGRAGSPQGRRRGRRPALAGRHAGLRADGRFPDRPPPGEAARHPPAALGRRLRPAAPPKPHRTGKTPAMTTKPAAD